jgi:flavin-dependent dehydrogenase
VWDLIVVGAGVAGSAVAYRQAMVSVLSFSSPQTPPRARHRRRAVARRVRSRSRSRSN